MIVYPHIQETKAFGRDIRKEEEVWVVEIYISTCTLSSG